MKRVLGLSFLGFLAATAIFLACSGPQGPLKIGACLPLTGDIASYGIRVKQGAEIALLELKDKGLPSMQIDFQDDANSATSAVGVVKAFATVNHYPAFIGAAGSSVSLAVAPVANEYKMVQLSPLSSSEQLSKDGGAYFFRVCPADDQQARIVANWVAGRNYTNVAVIYTNNSWGKGLAEGFKRYYEPLGKGKIAVYEATEEGQTDFRTVIAKAKKEGCQALISPTYPKEGGQLVKQAKELGFKADLYGADNWGAPEFLQIAKTAGEGCLFVAQYSYDGQEFQALNSKFKAQNAKDADVCVAYGYDAVNALASAVKAAKSPTGPAIRDALRSVRFQGASGYIEFDEHGNLKTDAFVKKMIKDGKTVDFQEEK
jgi:branched-chain amino acid transport system substrate-binding protein